MPQLRLATAYASEVFRLPLFDVASLSNISKNARKISAFFVFA
nr:MAG TPA: hypothetical protein [Caudoviricetes sp.]